VVKVRADSLQNNKKTTVLQFKMGGFVKSSQISSKINIFAAGVVFRHFVSFSSKTKSFGDY